MHIRQAVVANIWQADHLFFVTVWYVSIHIHPLKFWVIFSGNKIDIFTQQRLLQCIHWFSDNSNNVVPFYNLIWFPWYIDTSVKFHKEMLIASFFFYRRPLYMKGLYPSQGFHKCQSSSMFWDISRVILFIGMFWKKNMVNVFNPLWLNIRCFGQNMGNKICQCCFPNKYCPHL